MSTSITDWAETKVSRSLMLNQLMQLIDLFADRSPHQEVFDQLRDFVSGESHWHVVCNVGLSGVLEAEFAKEKGDSLAEVHYHFLGVVGMALHNLYLTALDETSSQRLKQKDSYPFRYLPNPEWTYWIVPCALDLAHHLGIDQSEVIRIVANSPYSDFEK